MKSYNSLKSCSFIKFLYSIKSYNCFCLAHCWFTNLCWFFTYSSYFSLNVLGSALMGKELIIAMLLFISTMVFLDISCYCFLIIMSFYSTTESKGWLSNPFKIFYIPLFTLWISLTSLLDKITLLAFAFLKVIYSIPPSLSTIAYYSSASDYSSYFLLLSSILSLFFLREI